MQWLVVHSFPTLFHPSSTSPGAPLYPALRRRFLPYKEQLGPPRELSRCPGSSTCAPVLRDLNPMGKQK